MIFFALQFRKMEAHKFSDIYDKLNNQPHLQNYIKEHYYGAIEKKLMEEAKDTKFHLLDTLNYGFKNVRQHQEEIYGKVLENSFLIFIKHSAFYQVIRNGKFGPQIYGFKGIIEQYYGNDWKDYHEYEYLCNSESDSDIEFYDCMES